MPGCAEIEVESDRFDGWLWHAAGCGKQVCCYYKGSDVACSPNCPRTLENVARDFLECPAGELAMEDVSFGRNNKLADPYRWGEWEISGCGRAAWCLRPRGEKLGECRQAPDVDLAVKQLAVESGCEEPRIRQLQRHADRTQATTRFDACGNQFSCVVPLAAPEDNETPVPASVSGNMISCKAALGAPAAAPVATPP
jgi:hypothetical protein